MLHNSPNKYETVNKIDGVAVRIYSSEKTIADCFKYRYKIGLDMAIEALKLYREKSVLKPMT
jgi:predicted transcriptional regulator of viral defense system